MGRRQTTRVDCCYPVDCSFEQESFRASVINMGLGGLRLVSPKQLPLRQKLRLSQSTSNGGELQVEVVWSRAREESSDGFESGVIYRDHLDLLEKSWVKQALVHLGFEKNALYERRRHRRSPVSVQAKLGDCKVAVLDLGLGGALVEAPSGTPFQEGQMLDLVVSVEPSLPLQVQVVYQRARGEHHRYGLCFMPAQEVQERARLIEGYLAALTH
jgi:hypothetical protein